MPVRRTHYSIQKVLQMAHHDVSSSGIYTDYCKYWCRKPIVEKTWSNFKILFALEYNALREEQYLNSTQEGFQHANHDTEEQKYFASELDNLSIADF